MGEPLGMAADVTRSSYECAGSTLTQSLMVNYAFTYTIYRPNTSVTYRTMSTEDAINKVRNGEIDCAMTEHFVKDSEDITQVASFLVPLSVIYNPPRESNKKSSVSMVLNLTIEDVAKIFMRNITKWSYFLPEYGDDGLEDADIRLIIRTDNCSENYYLTSAFSKVGVWSEKFGTEPRYTFPQELYENGGSLIIKTEYYNGIDSTVLTVPGSISYTGFAATLELREFTHFVNLRDGAGSEEFLEGSSSNYTALMDSINDYSFFEEHTDFALYNLAGTWPIGGVIFTVFSKYTEPLSTCSGRRELMLFWNWVYSEAKTRSYLDLLGITKMKDSINDDVLELIRNNVTCSNGLPAAGLLPREQHTPRGAFLAGFLITLILGVISLGVVVAYVAKEFRSIPLPAIVFIIFLLLGATSNLVSLVFYYKIPTSMWICQARVWLSRLGLSFMFTAVFVRAFQIRAIHAIGRKSRILTTKKSKAKGIINMALSFSGLIGLELLIMILWSAIDPFHPKMDKIEEVGRTFEYFCTSDYQLAWSLINLAYLCLLLSFGLYVVYNTWDMKYLVLESKWMAICIYNAAFILILVATTEMSIYNLNDDMVFWIESLGVGFVTILTLLALYLPKLFRSRLTNHDSESEEGSFNSAGT
ncbi:uncharacterized protein LOC126320442 isoform X2 [Schistocerca gregaria]|uniref:uncharacterized protein LOC126320442 isoform X2 n=1 Tax=Schistocerca gregaria TaxID=7010 RepID=UPI00211DE188|nr:uncharacterized protein LOC126320442 isoform X2 [Schistocerca gregaria]